MPHTTSRIIDKLQAAYPNDIFYVCKFSPPGGASSYEGQLLLNVPLQDGDWLRIYKLSQSSGPPVNNDIVKHIAFPFIYDTKSITNDEARVKRLCHSLQTLFPLHHVNVIVFNEPWESSSCAKGCVSFMKEYGSDVCVILS
ncbi:unnamed protein product [Rotaria sp. Silwood1]|nr:unnamed protein product [Rotaria sp. Silwood1]CAF1224810.1 unnamed protein product [Rotaria sp. Silwood1]CAF3477402.1 unnamed protein product [Rotaria sp. Silwood1]CAF3489470.1 unnamed protein product [Rotaria sp. Silwood1]CAF3504482.1 unnamed protein product [Rotaria sp. Silwood1]